MDLLEKIRALIGLERLYYGLINQDLISYAYQAKGYAAGIEPQFWNTAEGRNVLSSSGTVSFNGHSSLIIVSIPYELIKHLSAQASLAQDHDEPSPDAATTETKPISEADILKAISLLRSESVTESMTKAKRRDFLRQAFPGRRITETVFRRIEKAVPAKMGRRKKDDEEVGQKSSSSDLS